MTFTYDYLLNKFSQIFESVIFNNYNITFCNLTLKIKENINLEQYNLFVQEDFIDFIDFYKLELYNNKILDNYDKKNKLDNHVMLYFLNKKSKTKIIIKLNSNGIFDISVSNRNKQNINYIDIVKILYKLFKINNIDLKIINNISINLIQSYSNMFIDISIMNKLVNNKLNNNKLINLKKCNIYIYETGILLVSSDYNDMIDGYNYINLLLNEYMFEKKINKMENINDFLMEIAL